MHPTAWYYMIYTRIHNIYLIYKYTMIEYTYLLKRYSVSQTTVNQSLKMVDHLSQPSHKP